ncbi:MAG: cupin, partial [bacterium]
MDTEPIVNTEQVEWRRQSPGGQFDAEIRDVSQETGLEKIGFRQYRISPGKSAWPYHSHMANEEAIFIQKGEGT